MSARGGSGSLRETISTGRVFAAIPRSASQTSPGAGLIEKIQDFLLDCPRPHQVQRITVGKCHDLVDQSSDFLGGLGLPLSEFGVQLYSEGIHIDEHAT